MARSVATEREVEDSPIIITEAADWNKKEFEENMLFLESRGDTRSMDEILKVRDEAGKSTDWGQDDLEADRLANARRTGLIGYVAPENDVPSDLFVPDDADEQKKTLVTAGKVAGDTPDPTAGMSPGTSRTGGGAQKGAGA